MLKSYQRQHMRSCSYCGWEYWRLPSILWNLDWLDQNTQCCRCNTRNSRHHLYTGTAFWGNTAKAMYAHLFLCLKNHTRLAQWDFGHKELCLLVHTALGRLAVVFRKAEYLGSRMWPAITLYKLVTKRRWMINNTSTLSQTNHWSQWRKRALRESKQISHIGNRHILQQ